MSVPGVGPHGLAATVKLDDIDPQVRLVAMLASSRTKSIRPLRQQPVVNFESILAAYSQRFAHEVPLKSLTDFV